MTRQFYKSNFHEALSYIIPSLYYDDDRSNFGVEVDLRDKIINSYIDLANNISSVYPISAIPATYLSSINTLEGIAPYFVKQNDLSEFSLREFDLAIVRGSGRAMSEFDTSAAFSNYLTSSLLPSIRLNSPTLYSHQYLIENLNWLYFLNTSGPNYDGSSIVRDLLVSKLYWNQDITLADCMKGNCEFLFYNSPSSLPSEFTSGTGTYTSGTQQLDKLKTWMEIIYSPLHSDRNDTLVKDRFEIFIEASQKIEEKLPAGAFTKLIRAISLAAYDQDDLVETIGSFYSIDECPKELLPFLADLIGWKLFGTDPSRWRLQLKNAVEVYKRVGTKKGIQFAFNALYPKDQYQIDVAITELWESYVPYLIYYALATEAPVFKSLDTFTKQIAQNFNIVGYSNTNLDDNIRLAVDRILYEIYLEFTNSFDIPNIDNKFYYRGREYPIPPFEEYPYYVNVELTQDMIDFIVDRLACFGVRREFALQVRQYLIDKTINSDDEIRSSSWLFFTSEYQTPPNYSTLIAQSYSSKLEYASLWNGKSSHFKLILNASEFNFDSTDEYSVSSGLAMQRAAEITHEFAPAHAIPLINLQLSSTDSTSFDWNTLPMIEVNHTDSHTNNGYSTARFFNTYKRTLNPSGTVWGRGEFTTLQSNLHRSSSGVDNVYRNTIRRRNYVNLLPRNGWYDYTGFNPPTDLGNTTSSGCYLGFIPSSLSFQTISSVWELPAVYSKCQTLNSSSQFYGYSVSNTIPCYGIQFGRKDYYADMGETPRIYVLMHSLQERAKALTAELFPLDFSSLSGYDSVWASSTRYNFDRPWFNKEQSQANLIHNEVSGFPESYSDYENFKFGVKPHMLYTQYLTHFSKHSLHTRLMDLDGPNIYSYTFGSIIRNSDFDILGASASQLLTSSLSSIQVGGAGAGAFSSGGGVYIQNGYFVASAIVDGFELLMPSGESASNSFKVFKLPYSSKSYNASPYLFDKTFIQTKAVNGLPRVRVDLKTFENPSAEGHPFTENFLLPDYQYRFDINALVSDKDGKVLGDGSIGVWIHTKEEQGKYWSYNKDGLWEQHDSSAIPSEILTKYTHALKPSYRIRTLEEQQGNRKNLQCIEIASGTSTSFDPLLTFVESDFETLSASFNTFNNILYVPDSYFKVYGQVHRKTQNYVIEFFKIPGGDSFALIDYINLVNTSFSDMAKFVISGTDKYNPMRPQFCPEIAIEFTKQDIQDLFSFWNTLGRTTQSRSSDATEGTMGTRGGSRHDYRLDYNWFDPSWHVGASDNMSISTIVV